MNLGFNTLLFCGFSEYLTSLASFSLVIEGGESFHFLEALHFTPKINADDENPNSSHLLSNCYMPDTDLNTPHILSYLILTALLGRDYCDPHFTDEETNQCTERLSCARLHRY